MVFKNQLLLLDTKVPELNRHYNYTMPSMGRCLQTSVLSLQKGVESGCQMQHLNTFSILF